MGISTDIAIDVSGACPEDYLEIVSMIKKAGYTLSAGAEIPSLVTPGFHRHLVFNKLHNLWWIYGDITHYNIVPYYDLLQKHTFSQIYE